MSGYPNSHIPPIGRNVAGLKPLAGEGDHRAGVGAHGLEDPRRTGRLQRRECVLPPEGSAGEALEPGLLLGPGGRRLELKMEVRTARIARMPDEPDLLAGGELRAVDDGRREIGEVAVRPDLAVGAKGEADPAARVGLLPGVEDSGVRQRVDGRS